VIAKVFEALIGGDAPRQIFPVMIKDQVAPRVGIGTPQMPQRIDRQPLMRAMADAAKHGIEEQRHGGAGGD
jgi:hypothetical protein